jgi:hypothetical protein
MNTASDKLPPLPSTPSIERPLVSIVIVVWNARKYVFECLDSLREHCNSLSAEVIVVDNASTDGTPEMISEVFPEFTLIRNTENLGFAKANNIGMARSLGEYVCLVNSDVKFTNDCISPMLDYLRENPAAGMLGPKMLTLKGGVARSTMRFPTLWNSFCRAMGLDIVFRKSRIFGGFMMADFDHQTTRPVEVLNGWFLLIPRSSLERVGLLDPEFFMYGEDLDWCYRFNLAGEQVVFFAGAEAIHYGGASSSNAPVRFSMEMSRADWQLWCKHRGIAARAAYFIILALHHSIRLVGCSGAYLCLPSRRASIRLKLRKSVASLQWLSHLTNLQKAQVRNLA